MPKKFPVVDMELLSILLVFVILVAVIVLIRRKLARSARIPPGPFPWPFVGNVRLLQKLSQKLGGQHVAMLELSREYASPVIKLKMGCTDTYVISGKENIHEAIGYEELDGRPWTFFMQMRNMGLRKGITMNDGPEWKTIRNWFVRSLKTKGFARREMNEYITDELKSIMQNIQNGAAVRRMRHVIVPAIINVLWVFMAGKKFDESKLEYFVDLKARRARAFDMTGGLLSAFPWIRHIAPNYSGYNLLLTVNNEFKSIITGVIDEHKESYVVGSEADIIDMFLSEMFRSEGSQTGFDDDQLIMLLFDVLYAGLNITASTLDFLFLNMVINQESQRSVHEEIDRVVGRSRLPNMNDKKNMPYLEAVILESQRLTPVIPVIGPRRVLRDTELFGYFLPRDSFILMNLHSMHADPKLYPQPEIFKPERFLTEPYSSPRFQDDNLLLFGKGRRMCPGVALAKTALFLIFAGIMQQYELRPAPNQDTPDKLAIEPGLTNSPKPYDVLLIPRNSRISR